MNRIGGKFPILLMLISSVFLALSVMEIDAEFDSIDPSEVSSLTAAFIEVGPWLAIALFIGATLLSFTKASRSSAEWRPETKYTSAFFAGSAVITAVALYAIFGGIFSSLKEIYDSEHGVNPNSAKWIPIYSLLILAILASFLPVLAIGAMNLLAGKFLVASPLTHPAIEVELVNALGLENGGSERESSENDLELDVSTDDQRAGAARKTVNDPLTRLAIAHSDGHARLILKYYAQGYSQANLGFISSLGFAVIGFFAILASALSLWFLGAKSAVPISITGFSGAISGAVSFLFFRRADKGRELMMGLIDKLRLDREKELNTLRSLEQMEKFDKGILPDALRAAAALQFMNSSITLEQLSTFLRENNFGPSERDTS
ncbi:TRADD-N-associated membrane domain-containing protein [Streptomyces sp. cg40]|uniref:TRADD-N-associated membrane domain-containing protein n=1 Tax=Streptomyces sp. cg40 TaxID=3419764 RepID=UPI003D07E158